MSQAGIINVIENNPTIPIYFDADTGFAVALFNTIRIVGTGGITTSATGNTITIDGSGIGGGIENIAGDSGSITGTNVTIFANQTTNNSGATVEFVNSGTVSTLNVTDANSNTIIGRGSGVVGGTYGNCVVVGNNSASSMGNLTSQNVAIGNNVLQLFVGGVGIIRNVGIGHAALNQLIDGASNIAIGANAGLFYTSNESGNICIGNVGVVGDQDVTRIGNNQNACVIKGISGVATSNSEMVTIDTTTGQLGSTTIPSGVIETINGDSGSITGATVTIQTNVASLGCGSSVLFTNSGTTSTLTVTDSNNSTFVGSGSGKASASGTNNCGFGVTSLSSITSGNSNMGFGTSALASCTSGEYNVAVGVIALQLLTTSSENTAIGRNALGQIVTGANNIAIGYNAGALCTTNDSNNIHVGHVGVAGDNAAIRLGTNGTHTTCFVQGISGVTVTGTAVLCSTAGQLGTVASSERYKENIEDMQDNVSVMHLRPVKFNYKADDSKTVQYGLIAEDVDRDFPYLCFYKDNKPESVKYHELCVFLLAEIQRMDRRIKDLEGGK